MADRDTRNSPLTEPRKRVYILEQTVTERCYYDPDEIQDRFSDEWNAWLRTHSGRPFGDFVIEMFELHDGSQFGDQVFYNDANPSVGIQLVERWDDE